MPLYDYKCKRCDGSFEVKKSMKDPDPEICPLCKKKGCIDRVMSAPNITYANRPAWTYKAFKHYQTSRNNDGPRYKFDRNKVGDLACWNNPGELSPPTESDLKKDRKQREILKKGGYMSDAKKSTLDG